MTFLFVEVTESQIPVVEQKLNNLGYSKHIVIGLPEVPNTRDPDPLKYIVRPCYSENDLLHKTNYKGEKLYSIVINHVAELTEADILPTCCGAGIAL
jgi:hypothetical protein